MQLEQFAEDIVGVTNVPRMINQPRQGWIQLDEILAVEAVAFFILVVGGCEAINRRQVFIDFILRERIFNYDDAVAQERIPLLDREPLRSDFVLHPGHKYFS